jgi:ATP-dependent Clp protease adaptor protein ClpS
MRDLHLASPKKASPDKILNMATTTPEIPVPIQPVAPIPDDGGAAVVERAPKKVRPPRRYQVVLLNDDYTPMEFVVMVIQEFFGKDRETATQIMLRVHLDGRGVCGIYTRDVASTKVTQVLDAARQAGHPLQCVCEPVA